MFVLITSDDKKATRLEPFWFLPFSCLEDDSFETIAGNQPTFEAAVESENSGEFCQSLFFISAARMEKDDSALASICDVCDSLEKQGSDANPYLLAVYRSLKGEVI